MSSELQTGKARSLDCSNALDEDIALDSFIDKACGAMPHRPVSKKSKLGDCVDILTGYPFKSAEYSTSESDIKLVRGDKIAQGVLRWDDVKFWPKDKAEGLRDYLLQENDVLLAMDRPWIPAGLKFARLQKQEMPALLVQRVACLRPKAGFDRNFLFSIIASPRFADYIKNVSTGTAVPHISSKQIREFEFDRLEPEQEKAVGDFHFYIDDRIALLRETNATLEAMAQALFKSWFVDFDPVHANAGTRAATLPAELQALFPSTFTDTPQGPVPEGWKLVPFGELLSHTIGGDWGDEQPTEKNDVRVAIIRGTDLPDLANGHSGRVPIRFTSQKKLATRKLQDGDLVLEVSGGSKDQPTGRSLYLTNGILSQFNCPMEPASFCRLLRPATKEIGVLLAQHMTYIYGLGKTWEYQNQSTGISNFQTMHFLENELVTVPDGDVLRAFSETIRPMVDRAHLTQIAQLATLRDTLLPRLISGQLRLPDTEAALAEAGS